MQVLLAQLDPSSHVQGIQQGGLIYVAVIVTLVLGAVIGILWKSYESRGKDLMAERALRLEDQKAHSVHVESILKSHMEMSREQAGEQKELLENVYTALERYAPKGASPSRREGRS